MVTFSTSQNASLVVIFALRTTTLLTYWNTYLESDTKPSISMSLLNMKGYFDTIPREIEEAAEIDGASGIQLVTRIVLPLARPSILVTAVMILIYVWNEYLFATTFMTGAENYTLAAGLYSLQATEMSGSWPVFAAASLVVSLPILIVFFAVQRHMTSGLTAGGVKG